jgi:hypothetical protein
VSVSASKPGTSLINRNFLSAVSLPALLSSKDDHVGKIVGRLSGLANDLVSLRGNTRAVVRDFLPGNCVFQTPVDYSVPVCPEAGEHPVFQPASKTSLERHVTAANARRTENTVYTYLFTTNPPA